MRRIVTFTQLACVAFSRTHMRICRLNWIVNVRELSRRLVKPESLSNSGGHMNSRVRGTLIALGLSVALAAFSPSSARAQEGAPAPAPEHAAGGATVRAGYLTCHVESGWGFIFGSSRKLKCAYALQPGYTEYY